MIRQYLMVGKLVALLGAIAIICWQSSQIHRWHTHYDSERSAHQRDNASYQRAQKDAALAQKAQVASVEQQYQKVTDNAKDAYARDHAELVRLRQQRDAAPKGSANGAGSPPAHSPGPAIDGHGVQVPPPVDLQTKDAAADIELRLLHLQNYVEGLLAVDPNAPR